MTDKPNGDWGDLVNGDHERDLGSHGREPMQGSLFPRRELRYSVSAFEAQVCPACGRKRCDCGPGKAA